MKTNRLLFLWVFMSMGGQAFAQADSLFLQEIVVTGTRYAVDVRHLPMTVTVIGRDKLTEQNQPSVLSTVWKCCVALCPCFMVPVLWVA